MLSQISDLFCQNTRFEYVNSPFAGSLNFAQIFWRLDKILEFHFSTTLHRNSFSGTTNEELLRTYGGEWRSFRIYKNPFELLTIFPCPTA